MPAASQSPSQSTHWNLNDLYAGMNDPKISEDLAKADTLIAELNEYRGKIATLTPKQIVTLLKEWEELAFLFHKLDLFAGLLESTLVNEPDVTRFTKRIDEQLVLKGKETIFIEVEFARLTEEKWNEILPAPEVRAFHHLLEEFHKQAKHTLSEPEEKILVEKSQTSWQALSHLYKITTDTLEFEWDGKNVTLEEILTKFYDPSREIRKQAAITLHAGLKVNDKTTPAVYNALVQDKSISDRLRHYDYPEESRFISDEVDRETVDAMLQAVTSAASTVEKYYILKKRILDSDRLYWWDRYAPLPEVKAKIDAQAGQKMVVESYREFSPKMAEIVDRMYRQEHIDWFPASAKQGGAFCAMSGRDIYPYVLLNYTDTPRDVMTLAHELGHAIHDVMAQEKNTFFQTHPSLALAEIASIFGEVLLFEKLINSDLSREDRIALIMSFIEDIFASVFRQATMFQFEQAIHLKRRDEGELSKEDLDTLWQETMSKPFATSLEYTDEHKNTWMYVPHIIRSPFYVYSYAFAKLCVLTLVQEYRKRGKKFVPVYLQILAAGGSLSPKKNLRQAGLDISSPDFWQGGLTMIESYIDQLRDLEKTRPANSRPRATKRFT